MRFLVTALLTAALSFALCLFLPWWAITIAAFAVAVLLPQKLWLHFTAGFTALFFLWALLAFVADARNESVLSQKIAQVLPLGGSAVLLILVTALVGAVVGGLAAWTGGALRQLVRTRRV